MNYLASITSVSFEKGFVTAVSDESAPRFPQINANTDHSHNEIKTVSESSFNESIWLERMKCLRPLRIPHETTAAEIEPRWVSTAWSPSLLHTGKRDARRKPLEAFLIYLAEATGERDLHLGWHVEHTTLGADNLESHGVVVPIIVTVNQDEPWASVSRAVDSELLRISQGQEHLLEFTIQHFPISAVSSGKINWPWKIVVSNTEKHTEEMLKKGATLTLEIDNRGNFRWIFDATRLTEEVVRGMSVHLSELVKRAIFETDDDVPICRLDVFSDNDNCRSSSTRKHRGHDTPHGEIETGLAMCWKRTFDVEHVGRNDSFFALGGNWQKAIQSIEYMRAAGMDVTSHDMFDHPVLSELARHVRRYECIEISRNLITPGARELLPDMLPHIDLTQSDINRIISRVPGGIDNIQDIYELSPLQDAIHSLFLLANEEDPQVTMQAMVFSEKILLDRHLAAVQSLVNRHDILRTAFATENLTTPARVVLKRVKLSVNDELIASNRGSMQDLLEACYKAKRYRIDIRQAPLLRCVVFHEKDGECILLKIMHYMIGDQKTLRTMHSEVQSILSKQMKNSENKKINRNIIAHVRLKLDENAHQYFFTQMLAEIDEPTLSFGLANEYHDESSDRESRLVLSKKLKDRLGYQAKRLGTTVATLCHLAWALVVSRTSVRKRVVFGTVLFADEPRDAGASTAIGLWINVLPMRIDVNETSVSECIQQIHVQLAGLLKHRHASLRLAKSCSSVAKNMPLFNTLLNYRHVESALSSESDSNDSAAIGSIERIFSLLTLYVNDDGVNLALIARVVHSVESERVCLRMTQALESTVKALEHSSETQIRSLEVLPREERSLVIDTWNTPAMACSTELCIHQLFEQQVAEAPNAVALIHEQEIITYEQLNVRANRLAHSLIGLGIGPEDVVAMCVSRSPVMVISVLAILKSGAAYLPLDPAHSSKRMKEVLDDARPNILLVDQVGRVALRNIDVSSYVLLDPNASDSSDESNPKVHDLNPHTLAYVIYTSGSMGKPKGVMIEHRNIVRLFDVTESKFHFNRTDVWCLVHSIAFDVSVWELWGALRYGGALAIVSHDVSRSPQEMHQFVCMHNVTVLNQTPSAFKAAVVKYLENPTRDCLRYIIMAGERLDPFVLSEWFSVRGNCKAKLVNMYGLTETTVHATFKLLNQQDTESTSSPIGTRLADLKIYLLDVNGQPVPVGVTGEIYVSGAGIARGYLNRPKTTCERFLADTFSKNENRRMYKTGDLTYYSHDGNLIFVGRDDQQMKIRGFRIELGEIEACLVEYHGVQSAIVLTMSEETHKRLIAYVITNEVDNLVRNLYVHALSRLPAYMVPSAYVRIEEFPLTPNGKLDTNSLPTPDDDAVIRRDYAAPQGEIEESVAKIWSEQLGVNLVSRHDSFFELGGHSLLAVRVCECLSCLGLVVTVRDFFEHPILAELADCVRFQAEVESPPNIITQNTTVLIPSMLPLIDLRQEDIDRIISKVPGGLDNIQDIYALSPLQDGILFHHLLEGDAATYVMMHQIAFSTRDLLNRYLVAVQHVVDRHDVLRTAFVWEQLSTPAQVVWRHASVSVTELEHSVADGSVSDQLASRFARHSDHIDIRQAPLLRLLIMKETDNRWILQQLFHHLVVDHMSLEIMSDEIAELMSGREETLVSPFPFRDFIAHIRFGVSRESHIRFFTEMLVDIQEPSLSFGLVEVHHSGPNVNTATILLSRALDDCLRSQAKRAAVSLAAIFHLAWAKVVSVTSGSEKSIFGTVLFGRMQAGHGHGGVIGLFINTLPMKVDIDDTSVEDCTRRTHSLLARLLENEHASLADAQRCSSVTSTTLLFNTLLNYRHSFVPKEIPGMTPVRSSVATNYPLILSLDDDGLKLCLTAQTINPVEPSRVCSYMQRSLEGIADALKLDPRISIRSLKILPETDRALLIDEWNSPMMMYPTESCIHQLFERQVAKAPDATALVYEGGKMTYAELNTRSNRLAHHLIALGVRPEQIVAMCVDRSPAMVISVLAILKAGGAYLPLDPAHSSERMIDVLRDAVPTILLADNVGWSALEGLDIPLSIIVDPNEEFVYNDSNPNVRELNSQNLAYVIYTSGSTGKPKGVMVEHRNIVRLHDAAQSNYNFDKNDVWCLIHSIAFDFSVWEFWGALRYGGILVLVSFEVARSPQDMYELVCSNNITVLNQTPSAFKAAIGNYVKQPIKDHLRFMILAGERLDPYVLATWFGVRGQAKAKLVNMYGLTETTVVSTFKLLNQQDCRSSSSPIGSRFSDTKLYLLNANRQPVPIGVTGELYIGGAGVARGYLNRPDTTRERFLVDIFSKNGDDRMYKSGDLARYLPDGSLVFVGRHDQQLKIRGFRIELGEIEACLAEYSAVQNAIVLVCGDEANKYLVAYLIADNTKNLVENLRLHVAARLPAYMMPSAFVKVDAFPLTPNGKLDVQQLPAPDDNAVVRRVYESPRGRIETSLALIWEELLRADRVSRYDSFFELGGHSVFAVRVCERLSCLGLMVTVRDIFEHPILAELAGCVTLQDEIKAPPNVITPNTTVLTPSMLPLIDLRQADIDCIISKVSGGLANIQDIYALSPLQDGILFHHLFDDEADAYVIMQQIAFATRDLLDRYLVAVQLVVDRHDVLRTAFMWEQLSTPAQVVLRHASVTVSELNYSFDDGSACDQLSKRYARHLDHIDIRQAPLLHLLIMKETDDGWILQQLVHHLVVDHVSLELISDEIAELMSGWEQTPISPVSFRDLIAHIRFGVSRESHIRFFTEMLVDIQEPSLSFGLVKVHHSGFVVNTATILLPGELDDRLRSEAKRAGVSLAAIAHLAWAKVVAVTSGFEKSVFGTVLFGRMQAGHGHGKVMGLFINTLPIRIDIDYTSVLDCTRETHLQLARLLEHEHASLADAQRCSGLASTTPLFNTLLNYRHNLVPKEIPGMTHIQSVEATNYPLILCVDDDAHQLSLTAQTIDPVEPHRVCSYMRRSLEGLVNALELDPQISIRSLEILPAREKALLIDEWNSPVMVYSTEFCIHQLFERQVAKAPDATALIYEMEKLTYAELNIRSNRLAHYLISLGVGPERIVAMCVDRSPLMVIGVLAILKAGGAYLPLDPTHSSKRMIEVLKDAMPTILLADDVGRFALESLDISPYNVVHPNETVVYDDSNPNVRELTSQNLAYVIYTSGSTGKPKGVMVEHRNIVRLHDSVQSRYHFDKDDIWCLVHSIAFDVSVWELWGALRYGGVLVLVPFDVARSPKDMHQLVCSHNITVLNQTPSAFKAAIANYIKQPIEDNLRFIIMAGERLDPYELAPWFAVRGHMKAKLVNMYGLTETTVHSTFKVLNQQDCESLSSFIGSRLSDMRIYLLDANRQPVPIGITGELYIGGAGVTRGYLNRPDTTRERFLVDIFSKNRNNRMYKSGDLARFLPDGSLVFVGRQDQQVKIRGFRIELGEVEACLAEYSGVRTAIVLICGDEANKYLVAYLIADDTENLVENLRLHVTARLPVYMVPSAFVRMDAFPLTPNGKLDIQQLPAPDDNALVRRVYEPPRDNVETSLALIWGELLGINRVSRYDSFFDLGGNSLLAVRMVNLAADQGLSCTMHDLFQCPILDDLAKRTLHGLSSQQRHGAILVRAEGTDTPLFLVPTGTSDISYAFALARVIRPGFPIFVLPWPTLNDDSLITTFEDVASRTIVFMKEIQSNGPYRICGYSSGGILGYCIAQLLLTSGDSVSFLGLIDTAHPLHIMNSLSLKKYLIATELMSRLKPDSHEDFGLLIQKTDELNSIEVFQAAQHTLVSSSNYHPEIHARFLEEKLCYHKLARDFLPQELNITVHYFHAIEAPEVSNIRDVEFAFFSTDASLGWASQLPKSVFQLVPIAGDHDTMMLRDENRSILGHAISVALDST